MRSTTKAILGLLLTTVMASAGCGTSSTSKDPAEPVFATSLFTTGPTQITNPYFPLTIGQTCLFQKPTEDGMETVVEEVLDETRVVAGITCVVVRVREYEGELIIEDSRDWYAQDDQGNVWYMGEIVINYEYDDDDNLVGTNADGSWEAGADVAGAGSNATAGIIMKANPQVGDTYPQEIYPGEAEDMGAIHALNVPVTLACGSSYTCIQTREWNPLDPSHEEFKFYAPGVGLVTSMHTDLTERVELRGKFQQTAAAVPVIGGESFSNPTQIDNPYFPLVLEAARTFAQAGEDGAEELIIVETLDETRTVMGIPCRVVRDRVYEGELLVEDTRDWYCQDDAGNVWYMGEEVLNYEYDDDGVLTSTDTDGSWEAGIDGALPGYIMRATPVVGFAYYQEWYEDEAEDMAVLIATNATFTDSCGTTYTNCCKFLEWTPLEPTALEHKYFAPGLGVVGEVPLNGESQPVEFLGAFDLSLNSLPDISGQTFSNPSVITHPLLGFGPGMTASFMADTEDGLETILIEVQPATQVVDGLVCAVVRDRVFLDGLLIEDTLDWYAQDDAGNVWYMGEAVLNYEYDDDDMLIGTDTDGSWEAGVDGAEPGILMWATPAAGLPPYRQEYWEDEAEDMGLVIATGVTVTLGDGTVYTNAVKILEWTPLEPYGLEHKYFVPSLGVVLEQKAGGGERVERTSGP